MNGLRLPSWRRCADFFVGAALAPIFLFDLFFGGALERRAGLRRARKRRIEHRRDLRARDGRAN